MNREQALLLKIMEECDELSQRASKAIQFTLPEKQFGQDLTNFDRLRNEYVDLIAAIYLLSREVRVTFDPPTAVELVDRYKRIEDYIEYSQQLGTVEKIK